MSHLVLARKYRPLGFSTVQGQEHVTKTLIHCIQRDRIPHAILLTGPRGVGKTSIARIFAKCLNCQKGVTDSPCLECTNCKEIASGTSTAVREIDGASHNSVDNVRELIEGFRTLPAPGSKYKVYIIDEVHMLSTAAFNALLKSLEEPPPHTVFILATTEVHKIPETVLSRCQRHDLRAISSQQILDCLREITNAEQVSIDDNALSMVVQVAQGSMRDAQTALERLIAFGQKGKVTSDDATDLFGFADKTSLFLIMQSIIKRDPNLAIQEVAKVLSTGVDIITLIRDFVTHCRQVLIAVIGGEDALKEQISVQSHIVDLIRQAKSLTLEEAKDISTLSRELGDQAIRSSFPEYAFEALVIRLATRAKAIDLKNLINAIQNNKNISQATSTSTTTSAQIQKSYTNTPSAKSNNGSEANQFGNKSWNSFVEFVQTKSRMLSEQLKRVSLNKFEDSVLELSAPEFSFNYLDKKENRDTLLKLLTEFSPSANGWKFNLKLVESKQGAAEGSIVDLEVAKQQKTKASKEAKVLESPHIQAIQNLFPGSKINVKVKE